MAVLDTERYEATEGACHRGETEPIAYLHIWLT